MSIDRIFKPTDQQEEYRDVWRICYAAAGFREAYGRWPTLVRVHKDLYAYVRELLTEKAFHELIDKLELHPLPDFGDVLARDDDGREWSYGNNELPDNVEESTMWFWGVRP